MSAPDIDRLRAPVDQATPDALLPMHRKARLWALFGQLYGELTREAQDDFDTVFGKEFLRAYEARLNKLKHDSTGRR